MEIPDYLRGGPNLTDEESAALAARAQDGDAEARARMTRCHMRLASHMARITRTRYMDQEERFQEALIILDRCTMHYNAKTGVPFQVYAGNQIRLRIMKAVDRERRTQAEKNPAGHLTERQAQLLELRGQGKTAKQMARKLGLSVNVVEEECSRANEAFAAVALSPKSHTRDHSTTSFWHSQDQALGQNPLRVLISRQDEGEGEASDLDRLIRVAKLTLEQEQTVRMRGQGRTFREIARELGMNRHSVSEEFQLAIQALTEAAQNADR